MLAIAAFSLRGYAPAAIESEPGGVSCSARCTRALLWWEVSPVFHHRLDLRKSVFRRGNHNSNGVVD